MQFQIRLVYWVEKEEATREGGICVEQFGERDAAFRAASLLFGPGAKRPTQLNNSIAASQFDGKPFTVFFRVYLDRF